MLSQDIAVNKERGDARLTFLTGQLGRWHSLLTGEEMLLDLSPPNTE